MVLYLNPEQDYHNEDISQAISERLGADGELKCKLSNQAYVVAGSLETVSALRNLPAIARILPDQMSLRSVQQGACSCDEFQTSKRFSDNLQSSSDVRSIQNHKKKKPMRERFPRDVQIFDGTTEQIRKSHDLALQQAEMRKSNKKGNAVVRDGMRCDMLR